MLGQAAGNSGLTRLTTAQTRGKPLPSPIYYYCSSPRHPHSNGFLSRDSQGGIPKLSRFGLSQLCETITLCLNLWLGRGLKQSCSSCWELPNGVLHSICTHQGRVNSRLLVVEIQTANLTLSLSFCHNLCWRSPNGSCKAIFDIYTLIAFQWYKKRFNTRCFDPYNRTLKFQKSQRTLKSPFRECEFHILTFSQSRVATIVDFSNCIFLG